MTAPVRDLGVKVSAQGSETVKAAIAQVSAAAQQATERAARAAADAARLMARRQEEQVAGYQMTLRNAEQAAYAEQALRTRTAEQARLTAQQSAAAQQAAAAQTARTVSDRYGMMALSVAASFNQMAFAGKTTGGGLRNVVVQTALVATQIFGKGGPWGAAIAVGMLSLNTIFARGQEAAKEMREEWEKTLRVIGARRDYAGAGNLLRDLYAGDPNSDDPNEQMGLARLRDHVAREQQRIRQMIAAPVGRLTVPQQQARKREIEQLHELEQALAALERRYASVQATFTRLAALETERLANLAAMARDPSAAAGAPASMAGRRPLSLPTPSAIAPPAPDLSALTSLQVPEASKIATNTAEEIIARFRENQTALSNGIAETLAGGIAAGIAAAVTSGDIGTAIRSLASTVLAGLGNVFAEIAVKAMMQATLMIKFQAWLTANPFIALAAATAMLALARGMGGRAGGSTGGGFAGSAGAFASSAARPSETTTRIVFGENSLATAAGMMPRQAVNVTIIGPDDPNAQRSIQELIRKSQRRGDL